jgi:D-amino-acid dehydrogenase
MQVVVLGSGMIGVTTAWYLAQDGHEVTVLDRQPGSGLETSFANAGQLVPSHADPWAAPGAPRQILRWLGREDAPLLFRLRADPAQWAWGLRFLRNCTPARFHANTARVLRLGLYGRDVMAELRQATGIAFDWRPPGSLAIFREAKELEAARAHAAMMTELGCPLEVADPARVLEIEPALTGAGNTLAGGLYCAADEAGDAHKFTGALADLCRARGADFRYGTTIRGLETERGRIAGVVTDQGRIVGDAYVLALGSFSAGIARRIGIRLPVYPVKGYSITAPLADRDAAPRTALIDTATKVAFTTLGDRLRVGGTAELTGYDARLNPGRGRMTVDTARALLPRAADYDRAEHWAGLRPATPDQVPVLGPSKYMNLWINTGHGTLGWTLACASGRVIADLIEGRDPGIDLAGLTVDRF